VNAYVLSKVNNDWDDNTCEIQSVHSTLEGAQAATDEPEPIEWTEHASPTGFKWWAADVTVNSPSYSSWTSLNWDIEEHEVKP